MALKLYNTLSGQIEEFKSIIPNKASLYACGPTVYDDAHLGHARATVAFDLLVRHLKNSGYEVNYARNFTDVDDKIIERAHKNKISWQDLAQKYIQSFTEDMEALGCLKPAHQPRATEYIAEMIKDIEKLIEKKHAYELNGDVYFDVKSYADYGKLSRRDLEEQNAGARVMVDDRKKSPYDFALWKKTKDNEPFWVSPWGKGRPGWHIECSTMSHRLFGDEFDIHGGGQDLIFPHHENELAQSAALGRKLAHTWTHNGFVRVNYAKMSKSMHNFFTVKEVLKAYNPQVIRFFLLSSHYRGPIDFTEDSLKEAGKALERIYRALKETHDLLADDEIKKANPKKEIIKNFKEALDDDLNTSKALGILFEAVKELNKALFDDNKEEAASLAISIYRTGQKLGLLNTTPKEFFSQLKTLAQSEATIETSEIEELIEKRSQARDDKNWDEADRIRTILTENGVLIEDTSEKTLWHFA